MSREEARASEPGEIEAARDTIMSQQLPSRRVLRWVVLVGVGAGALFLVLLVASFADWGMPEPPPLPDPIEPPARTAVQDEAVRRLVLSAGQSRLCEQLQGTMMPLPDRSAPAGRAGGQAPAIGRFWIERCQAEQRDTHLALHLEGRGWTWANETRVGPMNTRFTVRGYLRFLLNVDLEGALDLGYSESNQVASIWLTPARAPAVRLTLQGEVPVQAQSGFGGLFGVLGQVFGNPVESRARPVVEQFGANEIARRLTPGLTTTVELCSGQLDIYQGALANGETPLRPYPPDGTTWLANQRIELQAGGVDVAGPWDTEGAPLRVDLEVEQGGPVEARVLCQDAARQVTEAFLAQRPASPVVAQAQQIVTSGRAVTLRTRALTCPAVLVVTPRDQASGGTRFRYRVVAGEGRPEPILTCGR